MLERTKLKLKTDERKMPNLSGINGQVEEKPQFYRFFLKNDKDQSVEVSTLKRADSKEVKKRQRGRISY